MRKSIPSTVIVQSLIMVCVPNQEGTKKCDFVIVQLLSTSCAPDLLSKSICVCGGGSGGGVRTRCWEKRHMRSLQKHGFDEMDALWPQRAPSSPSTAAPLASIDPQHFSNTSLPHRSSHCDFTCHNVDQVGDGVDKRPDPLVVGLWVDGADRRADGRTPRALLGYTFIK